MATDPAELEEALKKVRDIEPTQSIDPPEPTLPPEQPEQVGVVVVKIKDDQGNIKTDIVVHGVEPTEVQTLLELGLAGWREKIGLSR